MENSLFFKPHNVNFESKSFIVRIIKIPQIIEKCNRKIISFRELGKRNINNINNTSNILRHRKRKFVHKDYKAFFRYSVVT